MIPTRYLKGFYKKGAKELLISIGMSYSVFSAAILIFLIIKKPIYIPINSLRFIDSTLQLHNSTLIIMVLLILLGLCFTFLGLLYERAGTKKFTYHISLCLFLIFLLISSSFIAIDYLRLILSEISDEMSSYRYILYVIFFLVAIGVYFIFIYPHWIINKKIRNELRND